MEEAQACQSNGGGRGDTEQHNASEENTFLFHLVVDVVMLCHEMEQKVTLMYQNECGRRSQRKPCEKRRKHYYLEVAAAVAPELAAINKTIKRTGAGSNQVEYQ